jgi:hypothetical protein
MDRSRRLTDGTRWRTFMRLLGLDDLKTSYTNARPGAGLLGGSRYLLHSAEAPSELYSGHRTKIIVPKRSVQSFLSIGSANSKALPGAAHKTSSVAQRLPISGEITRDS